MKVGDDVKLSGIAFTCSDEHVGVTTTIFPDGSSRYGSIFTVTGITSTTYTIDVGISTIGHTYDSGGTSRRSATARLYANRPYDGQVVFIDQLYNQLDKIDIVSAGEGYTSPPVITVEAPQGTKWNQRSYCICNDSRWSSIKEIVVTNNGSQYTTNPTITLTGGNPSVSAAVTTGLRPLYYTVQEDLHNQMHTLVSQRLCLTRF